MRDGPEHPRLDPEDASAIIRRAAELDVGLPDLLGGVDRHALEEAAGEVGISPAAVRQALAEHDAGVLPAPVDRSILGPAHAIAVRTVSLPPATARQRVDRWLKGQMLEVQERRGDEVVWCRRSDLLAKVRRKVDVTKRVRLGGVDAVCASVVPVDDGSFVRLDADLENTRKGLIAGVAIAPTVVAPLAFGALAFFTDPLVFLAGFPAGAALGSLGLVAGRRTLANERAEAQRVLDLFLDELERAR